MKAEFSPPAFKKPFSFHSSKRHCLSDATELPIVGTGIISGWADGKPVCAGIPEKLLVGV